MGNDGGAVGRNFGGGGAATAKDHQANVILAGGGGALAERVGLIKGGNLNYGAAGGNVSKAEVNKWVRSGGKAGRKPVGALRAKAMDLHQAARRSAFSAAERKSMGMRGGPARASGNRVSGGGTRPPITTKWTASSKAAAQKQVTRLNTALAKQPGQSRPGKVTITKTPTGYSVSHISSMQANSFRGVKVGGRNTPADRRQVAAARGRAKTENSVTPRGKRQPPTGRLTSLR